MNIRLVSKLFPVFASAVLITACSQQPSVPEAGSGAGAGSTDSANGANTQGVNVGNGGGVSASGAGSYANGSAAAGANASAGAGNYVETYTMVDLNNPASLLSKRVIYFDYDLSTIKPEYQAVLDAHAKLLAKNPAVQVRLEGHADERGTREYNVALSEERAKSVQWYMRGQGTNASQMDIVAYGEERPAKVGEGEQSWAQNRRVEIRYPGR